jgi:Caspase recruitment domain
MFKTMNHTCVKCLTTVEYSVPPKYCCQCGVELESCLSMPTRFLRGPTKDDESISITPSNKRIIQKNWCVLIENVNPDPVVMRLYSNGVVNSGGYENIRVCTTSTQKMETLLESFRCKNNAAFYYLIKALKDSHQEFVLDMMDWE